MFEKNIIAVQEKRGKQIWIFKAAPYCCENKQKKSTPPQIFVLIADTICKTISISMKCTQKYISEKDRDIFEKILRKKFMCTTPPVSSKVPGLT